MTTKESGGIIPRGGHEPLPFPQNVQDNHRRYAQGVLERSFPKAELSGGDEGFERLVATVVGFVENPSRGLWLPLDIRGTAFQERVWRALMEIPAGKTATYSEIAGKIGAPGAARAVGAVCAANMLAVAIPCHRVVRTDGSLSGYRWGSGASVRYSAASPDKRRRRLVPV